MAFTLVFDGDLKAVKENPFKIETPFGVATACSVGDVLKITDLLREAVEPVAVMGVAGVETDIALLDYNLPFYDCPDDLILYHDHMGHALTVSDVRRAKAALRALERKS